MVSAEHFSMGKPIQFELVVMAATLNTAVNFCRQLIRGIGNCRKLDHQSAPVDSDPQARENELNPVDCRHVLSWALFCWQHLHSREGGGERLGGRCSRAYGPHDFFEYHWCL